MAVVPELDFIKYLGDIVGAVVNKHLENNYKCCT